MNANKEKKPKVLAILPARGGSVGLPRKNLAILQGKPLLAYAIEAAKKSLLVDRIVCSTDSPEIREMALRLGAEAPFLRPAELSGGEIPLYPVVMHALEKMEEMTGFRADVAILLQPTSPLRTAGHIDEALRILFEHDCDSVVSMCETEENPQWMRVIKQGKVRRLLDRGDANFEQRQNLPTYYLLNGAIYASHRDTLINQGTICGETTLPLIMSREASVDIDEAGDLQLAERLLSAREDAQPAKNDLENLPAAEAAPSPLETPIFAERVAFLNDSQRWPRSRLEELQLKKLRHILWWASSKTRRYADMFAKLGLSWRDFRSLSDIRRLPILTKREIQDNYDAFIPKGVRKEDLYHRSTGGSTGVPLTIYMDLDHLSRDKAATEYYMNVSGLNIFDYRSIRLYGDKIPRELTDKGVYWLLDGDRKLVMSCYHFTTKNAPKFVAAINDFAPEYIHTRPSAIFPLAAKIIALGLKLTAPPRMIFSDGEYLTQGQADIIEQAFQARMFNVYGHTEGCVMGHSCECSRLLHFPPQIGLLELIGPDGLPVSRSGDRGEMVVTGFNNLMFPLIRYRTGDVGVYDEGPCPCGREYPLLKEVEGRFQDYVVGFGGSLVPLAPAVFNYNDFDWKGIREFQVRQDEPGRLLFQIQLESDHMTEKETVARRIKKDIGTVLGGGFDIETAFVREIPRSRIGKLRYLDQQLDLKTRFEAKG